MNARMSKKLRKKARKMAKANWLEYVSAICQWPIRAKLRFARDIIFRAKQIIDKGE